MIANFGCMIWGLLVKQVNAIFNKESLVLKNKLWTSPASKPLF
jgi:hypothetical protein